MKKLIIIPLLILLTASSHSCGNFHNWSEKYLINSVEENLVSTQWAIQNDDNCLSYLFFTQSGNMQRYKYDKYNYLGNIVYNNQVVEYGTFYVTNNTIVCKLNETETYYYSFNNDELLIWQEHENNSFVKYLEPGDWHYNVAFMNGLW